MSKHTQTFPPPQNGLSQSPQPIHFKLYLFVFTEAKCFLFFWPTYKPLTSHATWKGNDGTGYKKKVATTVSHEPLTQNISVIPFSCEIALTQQCYIAFHLAPLPPPSPPQHRHRKTYTLRYASLQP